MAEGKQIDEQKTASASYIITFCNEVEALTHNYAIYFNVLSEMKHKYGESIPDDVKENLIAVAQNVRYYVKKTFIKYKSIIHKIQAIENKQIETKKLKLEKDFIMKMEELEEYVILMNEVITSEVMKGLLESSNEMVGKLTLDHEQ